MLYLSIYNDSAPAPDYNQSICTAVGTYLPVLYLYRSSTGTGTCTGTRTRTIVLVDSTATFQPIFRAKVLACMTNPTAESLSCTWFGTLGATGTSA